MDRPQLLQQRLQDIADSLQQTDGALALLALGSCGLELARMDAYSDLDFFVIVAEGKKQQFIADLTWLSRIRPLTFVFRNTVDGYKLLFEDGVFCENAIFEPQEMAHIPFAEGRIVWHAVGFDTTILQPTPPKPAKIESVEWQVNEALTNLYVGLGRYRRGEKLSGMFFTQFYTPYYIMRLAAQLETPQPTFVDGFAPERRFEQRFPQTAQWLPQVMVGYDHTIEAARAMLRFLETHFEVNPAMKAEIERLLAE